MIHRRARKKLRKAFFQTKCHIYHRSAVGPTGGDYTIFYHSRPGDVDDVTFWCFFRYTVLTAVHLQNTKAEFHSRPIQVRWKTFTALYGKFNQGNIHQSLAQLDKFCALVKYMAKAF